MSTSTPPMATAPKAKETFGSATHGSAGASPLVLAAFAAVYVIWGSTYLAIRVGVETIPPLMLAGLRHFTVGLLLYPILRWRTHVRPTAANWKSAAVTGCLLLFVGNGGVSWAEQIVPSGITALLVTMVSLWLVIVDWLRPGGHRPAPKVLLGLVLGFAGVALLVGPSPWGGSERVNLSGVTVRSEEHTSELQSPCNLVCRLLLEKKKVRGIRPRNRNHLTPPLSPTGKRNW